MISIQEGCELQLGAVQKTKAKNAISIESGLTGRMICMRAVCRNVTPRAQPRSPPSSIIPVWARRMFTLTMMVNN